MTYTKEQIEKAKLCNSEEELLSLAKENNIELSIEEADKYYNSLNSKLNDNELDNVTGGCDNRETVYFDDYCHFDENNFKAVNLDNAISTGQISMCKACVYNTGRGWQQSICDYPNEHY